MVRVVANVGEPQGRPRWWARRVRLVGTSPQERPGVLHDEEVDVECRRGGMDDMGREWEAKESWPQERHRER